MSITVVVTPPPPLPPPLHAAVCRAGCGSSNIRRALLGTVNNIASQVLVAFGMSSVLAAASTYGGTPMYEHNLSVTCVSSLKLLSEHPSCKHFRSTMQVSDEDLPRYFVTITKATSIQSVPPPPPPSCSSPPRYLLLPLQLVTLAFF